MTSADLLIDWCHWMDSDHCPMADIMILWRHFDLSSLSTNKKYFNIPSLAYNGEIMKSTWPRVTVYTFRDIDIEGTDALMKFNRVEILYEYNCKNDMTANYFWKQMYLSWPGDLIF